MQQPQINLESLAIVIIIPVAFVVMVIAAIIYARKYFRQKDKEKRLYTDIARQMNWNFSARGEGFETAKPYFEYLNRQILPDRLRLGSFPVNILWGNFDNALFAVFDFNYNNNPDSKNYNLRHEKGVLLVASKMNLSAFEIAEKNVLSKGIDFITGNNSPPNFAKNYQVKTDSREIINKLNAPEIAQIFSNGDIIRLLGNGGFLCLFFRRNVEEVPDLSRIQYQLNTIRRAAKIFEK